MNEYKVNFLIKKKFLTFSCFMTYHPVYIIIFSFMALKFGSNVLFFINNDDYIQRILNFYSHYYVDENIDNSYRT